MQITIPKVLKPLALSAYAAAMKEVFLVWVNIPSAKRIAFEDRRRESMQLLAERIQLQRKLAADKLADRKKAELQQKWDENSTKLQALDQTFNAFFSEVWSQGEDEATHVSVSDIEEIVAGVKDTDPSFYFWLTAQTISMIDEHRQGKKKKMN